MKRPHRGVVDSVIKFKEWDGDPFESLIAYNAKFRRDFGPFKKGEVLKSVTFSMSDGTLEEHDDEGKVLRSCRIKLVAVDSK